ncbi:hypothetical protein BBG47_19185 [Paenibacillus sp. KS1]|nr:hypothetical protein BBG47_19185 [Paenibacillus sp. KS1]
MQEMVKLLNPYGNELIQILDGEMQKINHPELGFAYKIKSDIQKSTYMKYHLAKAKVYAEESEKSGYRFVGYEDLELSTQLLLKAAVKRGITFKLIDRDENFVLLTGEIIRNM